MGRPSRYTEEFRREAVRLLESGKPLKQVARDLGISVESLRSWRDRIGKAAQASARRGRIPLLEEETRRLRRGARNPKKSDGLLRQGRTMRFAFIQTHARIFHIVTMCRVLQVSKAGYYAWRARPLCDRVQENQHLRERIRQIHQQVKQRYGSPRVYQELRALGIRCGENRVARLMRLDGLKAKSARRYRVTTQSQHQQPIAPNRLNRQFDVSRIERPNRVWAADLTYIPTGEGWLYLAVVLDLASRRVVGWALGSRLDQELALTAMRMALLHRKASGGLHHSDRGVQYASAAYQQLLTEAGLTVSMSRRGDCWDNAVVESFFATLTKELLNDGVVASRAGASRAIFEFIEIWYNRTRRHSTLGYRTPLQFEQELQRAS
jgi:transposase InsO family protein/transposase-like protein